MAAAGARDREAEALIETILKLAAPDGQRAMEPVFRTEPPRARWRWRRSKRIPAEVRTGWRIGCYYRSAPASPQSGYRVRRELTHPVYLLCDGRLAVGAFRAVDAEGAVTELQPRSPWFTPLEDSSAFFAARPEHYLDELRALYGDLSSGYAE